MYRLAVSLSRRGPRVQVPTLRTGTTNIGAAGLPPTFSRPAGYATSAPDKDNDTESASAVDEDISAKGRAGGGKPLPSSENPPPKPKVNNASVPGTGKDKLTKEQQEEVDRHNADFEKKHDRGSSAADDKVDKNFWSGGNGSR
ncbi:hypothetical protein M406DRAFT_68382 [Cryphonectria parasitica EP155]|uniref:Uncharacterized protein n=1 Tax=Cryphonectria parasitica (strain ATCC 38755 / EP155) TaxID=660469 RepID=A0A9P4Y437_CRYP1|nr:uncharacterized protein M406DRAFT_68382 [Cryphonectria parasitica EP155]KAF3766002.1 hypothetical protein M406DRAFT_68382 [Cryphonectria parasitica EP155]